MKWDLVVIGSSNMDLVISLPRIPVVGETVLGGKSSTIFGGKGANQAVAAQRSGERVSFITKLGKDSIGEDMRLHFKNEGFPAELILQDDKEPTGVAHIFVSEKGENAIAVAPGANMSLLPNDIDAFRDVVIDAKVVLLQLETPLETIAHVAAMAQANNVKLILNPAPAKALPIELLSKVWLITPNETEASLLTGIEVIDQSTAEKAAKVLLSQGVQNVIITLGAEGALLCNANETQHFPAFKVKPVDTTAAGDVFNGVLANAIAKNDSLASNISYASAAAAISVTIHGAQTSIPTQEEIEHFISHSSFLK